MVSGGPIMEVLHGSAARGKPTGVSEDGRTLEGSPSASKSRELPSSPPGAVPLCLAKAEEVWL